MRGFLNSSTASLAALAFQALEMASAAAALNGHQVGPGRKSHKRLTDGTPSTTAVRVTRQMERRNFIERHKHKYRALREATRWDRKNTPPAHSLHARFVAHNPGMFQVR